MTMMELLVALAILGLLSALAFSNIGPWLAQSRLSAAQSSFWRGLSPAQLLLSELTAGAIDPATRRIDSAHARFRVLAPRLSPTPIQASLDITREHGRSALSFHAEELGAGPSLILESTAPLRFADNHEALILEMQRGGAWIPIAQASFAANAPFVCAFDPIPRTCRQ